MVKPSNKQDNFLTSAGPGVRSQVSLSPTTMGGKRGAVLSPLAKLDLRVGLENKLRACES